MGEGLHFWGGGGGGGAGGPPPQALEGPEQVGCPRLCARLCAPLRRGDRVRPVPRQLEDRVGLRPFPGIPRHEDERAVHLAGVRLDPGGAARPRPGAPHRVRSAPGRGGPDGPPRVLLQRAPRRERPVLHRPVPSAHRLRRAPHEEREEVATGAVNPQRWPILTQEDHGAVARVVTGNRSLGFPQPGVEKFPRTGDRNAAKSSEGPQMVVARHDEVALRGHRTLQNAVTRLVGGDDRDALSRNDRLGKGLNECADTARPPCGPLELANQNALDLFEDRRGDEECDYLAAAESEDLIGDAAEVQGGDVDVGVGDNPDHLAGFAVFGDDPFDVIRADAQAARALGPVALEAPPLLLLDIAAERFAEQLALRAPLPFGERLRFPEQLGREREGEDLGSSHGGLHECVILSITLANSRERVNCSDELRCTRRTGGSRHGRGEGLLEVEHQPEGSLHLRHASWWYGPCEIRTVGLRVKETGWVQRANLKAQEYGVDWKAGFPGRHADVRWIVTRHIPCAGADDYRDDQWLAVNGVGRDHQDRSAPSLSPTVSGAEVDEVNLATANHP